MVLRKSRNYEKTFINKSDTTVIKIKVLLREVRGKLAVK